MKVLFFLYTALAAAISIALPPFAHALDTEDANDLPSGAESITSPGGVVGYTITSNYKDWFMVTKGKCDR